MRRQRPLGQLFSRRVGSIAICLRAGCGEVEKGEHGRVATFIMLNPSTADATHNDPTLRKCISFARQWQCNTLQVLNLFAVRATRPQDMKRIADPVGPENQHWFAHALTPTKNTHFVICAWGMHGVFMGQDRIVLCWLAEQNIASYALGFTQGGYPRHPLYVAYSVGLLGYTCLPY